MPDFKYGPAEDFEALASKMAKQGEMLTPVYYRLQNAVRAIQGGAWTGEGAGAFVAGANDLLIRIKELGLGLNELHGRFTKANQIAIDNMDDIDKTIDE